MEDPAAPPSEPDPLDQPISFDRETASPPPTPAPAPAPQPRRPPRFGPFLIYAGAWAMVGSLLMPWAYRAEGGASVAENALGSREGLVAAGLVGATLLLSIATVHAEDLRVRRKRAAALLVAAGIICVVANVFLMRLTGGAYKTEEGTLVVERSVGVGSIALVVFAIALAFGASMTFRAARRPSTKMLDDGGGPN